MSLMLDSDVSIHGILVSFVTSFMFAECGFLFYFKVLHVVMSEWVVVVEVIHKKVQKNTAGKHPGENNLPQFSAEVMAPPQPHMLLVVKG